MDDKTYFSYLLRMWQVVRTGEQVWMASLDDPLTGIRRNFTNMESLFDFLLQKTSGPNRQTQSQVDNQDD
jgi:hypothetical protein